jgi:hypothetical protein
MFLNRQFPGRADAVRLQLLGQKLRRAPADVRIDAARIVGRVILEVSGQPDNCRKFVAGLWIKIRVAVTAVDGAVPRPILARLLELQSPTGMSPAM